MRADDNKSLAQTGAGYLAAYLLFGAISSLAGSVVGTFIIFIAAIGWEGLVGFFALPLIPVFGVPLGLLLSIPVTFVVLPLLTLPLKRFAFTHLFALSVAGTAAGGWVTWWWIGLNRFSGYAPTFVFAGAVAGFTAGVIYAAMVRGVLLAHLRDRAQALWRRGDGAC